MRFPLLFSPFRIGAVEFKNRIVSTGHGTRLADRLVNDRLVAYHRARAKGGAGLIISEVAGVHDTAYYVGGTLKIDTDDALPGYRRLAEAVHEFDCRIIGQLFHAGRELAMMPDGSLPVSYSASDTPYERLHGVPRAMPKALIAEIVRGYAAGAARMVEAGLDGVEIVGAHGYLLAQFLNPRINRRADEYGGSVANRARLILDIASAVRPVLGKRLMGLRFSASEPGLPGGLDEAETHGVLALMAPHFDYLNVTIGSYSAIGSTLHTVPTMAMEPGYVAPLAGSVKARFGKPVLVSGRINRPDIAETIIAAGQADMCALTRGLIADPELPNKARAGRVEDIRACIGCNQACIGHNHKGVSISCIQHPETGRELEYGELRRAQILKRVLIAGGGPAGLKFAAVAASRGHDVTLYEREAQFGGQVRLAEKLPGRAEFGGIVLHLRREAERAGAKLLRGAALDAATVRRAQPDAVILATGARPRALDLPGGTEGAHVVEAWQVLAGRANIGGSVVVADWRCDWVGLGLAEMLARDGRKVRLCVAGYMPGETIQQYVRDEWLGRLHKLGVEIVPLARLAGADADSVYFEHMPSGEPIVCEGVDTLVTAMARESDADMEGELADFAGEVRLIGDCLSPRTAEEAVLDGLKAAWVL